MPNLFRIRLFILALGIAQTISAQKPDLNTPIPPDHPGMYRLILPDGWEHRHKLMQVITDILPETIDELKDRDFCTEGTASYYVQLLLDSITAGNVHTPAPVEINNRPYYTVSFDYSFYGALVVLDSNRNIISRLRLISAEEVNTYTERFSTPAQNITYRTISIYNPQGRVIGTRRVPDSRPVNNYVPRVNPWNIITQQFLEDICEKRIMEIGRLLKKITGI